MTSASKLSPTTAFEIKRCSFSLPKCMPDCSSHLEHIYCQLYNIQYDQTPVKVCYSQSIHILDHGMPNEAFIAIPSSGEICTVIPASISNFFFSSFPKLTHFLLKDRIGIPSSNHLSDRLNICKMTFMCSNACTLWRSGLCDTNKCQWL